MGRTKSNSSSNSSADLGFEAKLWLAADKLRSNMPLKNIASVLQHGILSNERAARSLFTQMRNIQKQSRILGTLLPKLVIGELSVTDGKEMAVKY